MEVQFITLAMSAADRVYQCRMHCFDTAPFWLRSGQSEPCYYSDDCSQSARRLGEVVIPAFPPETSAHAADRAHP